MTSQRRVLTVSGKAEDDFYCSAVCVICYSHLFIFYSIFVDQDIDILLCHHQVDTTRVILALFTLTLLKISLLSCNHLLHSYIYHLLQKNRLLLKKKKNSMVQIGNLKLSVWNLIRKLNVLRHTTLHMHASEKK